MILFAKDFRQHAREALKSNWVLAVLAGIAATVLGGYHIGINNGIDL